MARAIAYSAEKMKPIEYIGSSEYLYKLNDKFWLISKSVRVLENIEKYTNVW